jgi:hypothetical protein
MAVQKIEEVYLYTTSVAYDQAEMIQVKAFMDNTGIDYVHLNYSDAEQLEQVFGSLNTWWTRPDINLPPLTKFPFLLYTEVHDNIPARGSPVKYKEGFEDIQTFPDFYNSVMNTET